MKQEQDEGVVDATRRTRLAAERTYLAWWRSALAAFAVSLGVGKVVPELTSGESVGYELVGAGYAPLWIAFIGYGYRRQKVMEQALLEGRFVLRRSCRPRVHGCRHRARSRDARCKRRLSQGTQGFREPGVARRVRSSSVRRSRDTETVFLDRSKGEIESAPELGPELHRKDARYVALVGEHYAG